tara:strand:- start:12146 stop:14806 length:2661 start_codon:yes stop_codon:yes gene_type:complete
VAKITELMRSLNMMLDDKQDKEYRELDLSLKMYGLKVDSERDALKVELNRVDNELLALNNEFESKSETLRDTSGDLVDLTGFSKTDSALVVLDKIKSPVLNVYEEQINEVSGKKAQLRNAIKEIDTRLTQINKVSEYYEGKTIDPADKGSAYFDVEDFDSKALYDHLDMDESKAPKWLKNYVSSKESVQPGNLRILNTALDAQIIQNAKSKIDAYNTKDIGTVGFDAEVLMSELNTDISRVLDSKILNINKTIFSKSLELADSFAVTKNSFDTGQIQGNDAEMLVEQLYNQLQMEKAVIGNMFLLSPAQASTDETGNTILEFDEEGAFNEAADLGGLMLANFSIYEESMRSDGPRQVLPALEVFKELNMLSSGFDYELERLIKPKFVDINGALDTRALMMSQEYEGYIQKLNVFEKNIKGLFGLSKSEFSNMAESFAGFSDIMDEKSLLILNERLQQGNPPSQSSQYINPFKKVDIDAKDYDYSGISNVSGLTDSAISGLFNFDSDGDGVVDSFDLDGNNKADTPLEVEKYLDTNTGSKSNTIVSEYNSDDNTVMSGDTFFDIETEGSKKFGIVRDEDGEEVRRIPAGNISGTKEINVTDSKELLYLQNYTEDNSKEQNAKIDSVYSTTSRIDNILMNYISEDGNVDANSIMEFLQSIEVGSNFSKTQASVMGLNIAQEGGVNSFSDSSLKVPGNTEAQNKIFSQKFGDLTSGIFPAIETLATGEVQFGIRSGVKAMTEDGVAGMEYLIEDWNIFRALGGGGAVHDNSPWLDEYLVLMMEDYNSLIETDDEIWFPSFHRGSKFKSWMGEWAGVLGFNQDVQILQFFEKEYPEAFKTAKEKNLASADKKQLEWLQNVLNLKGNEDDNFEDRAEVLKLLTIAHGYNYK